MKLSCAESVPRVMRLALGALILTAAGCGGSAKPPDYLGKLIAVDGTVTVDGNPMAGIQVTFVPQQGFGSQNDPNQGRLATGTTDGSGKFTLVTPPGGSISPQESGKFVGALPGKYAATFSLWVMPDGKPWAATENQTKGPMASGATEKLPMQLGNPQSTPHKVEVKSGSANTLKFELKSK